MPEPALAWERVRAWDLNQWPPSFAALAPHDHLILTHRLSGRTFAVTTAAFAQALQQAVANAR